MDRQPNFYYVSANKYSEQTKLGYDETLRQCKSGELEAVETDGGQWCVKVYIGDTVSRAEYEKILQQVTELQTLLAGVRKLVS